MIHSLVIRSVFSHYCKTVVISVYHHHHHHKKSISRSNTAQRTIHNTLQQH